MIDEIIPEPIGGAHRDRLLMAENLKAALKKNLDELLQLPLDDLVDRRYQKLMKYGVYEEVAA